MHGLAGLPGWAWIFIIEGPHFAVHLTAGAVTVGVGIASWWAIADFPHDATFLSEDERAMVIYRLHADGQDGGKDEQFKWSVFLNTFKDWKTWMGMMMYMGADGALYAFALFLPSIIHEMGYTALRAQFMSVPPYAFACLLTLTVGYVADRCHQRGIPNIILGGTGTIAFVILGVSRVPALSYFATFLGAAGIYACIPNTISWVSNNCDHAGVYRRGVTLGAVIAWGNLNGVVSSNIYRKSDAPWYRMGHWIVVVYLGLFLLGGSLANYICLIIANRNRTKRHHGGSRVDGRFYTL
jgi:MFS transporter, ACS family, DAL5 transporter family protein